MTADDDREAGLDQGFLAHARAPRNVGVIPDPDGESTVARECGDTVRVQLRVVDAVVSQACFVANGCIATIACASAGTELVLGRSLSYLLQLDGPQVAAAVAGLPPNEQHCAELVADALRAAARDALEMQREPWKRWYRTLRAP